MNFTKADSRIPKDLIIIYDDLIIDPHLNGMRRKDLMKPYFIMPSKDYEFSLIGTDLNISNGFSPESKPEEIFGEVEKIILNPENQKFLSNNHVTIFIPDKIYMKAIQSYKHNYNSYSEFIERP